MSTKHTILNSIVTIFLIAAFILVIKSGEKSAYHPLTIHKKDGSEIVFQVEIARTPEQMEKGLMNRKRLPKMTGMLFLLGENKIVEMWMKDTYLPLDILFIDKDGIIQKIEENAKPSSEDTISSDTSVIAVLEINAMLSKKLHINVGDTVVY
jgi:uncharacterized membrane protein (UPF0127 family)